MQANNIDYQISSEGSGDEEEDGESKKLKLIKGAAELMNNAKLRGDSHFISTFSRGAEGCFTLLSQSNTNCKAYWVDQREVGYLTGGEIAQGAQIGTNNIQQCVAVIIDGYDKEGERLVALAHVDIYTTQKSFGEVFERFNIEKGANQLKINLYGARSVVGDNGFFYNASFSNFQSVLYAMNLAFYEKQRPLIINNTPFEVTKDEVTEESKISFINDTQSATNKEKLLAGASVEELVADIIYDPQTERIADGFPYKGYDMKHIRQLNSRYLDDSLYGYDKKREEGAEIERKSTLKEIILNDKNIQQTKLEATLLADEKVCEKLIAYYCEKYDQKKLEVSGMYTKITELRNENLAIPDSSRNIPLDLSGEYAINTLTGIANSYKQEIEPFFEITQKACTKLDINVSKDELYNGEAKAIIEKSIAKRQKHAKIIQKIGESKEIEQKIARGKFSGMELKRQTHSQSASKSKYEF